MSIETSRRQFSSTDFRKMAEHGIINEDERVELIDGEVCTMSPIGPRHMAIVRRLNEFFIQSLAGRATIGVQDSIELNDFTQPQPDITVLRKRADYYSSQLARPEDILLVVEVADSSLHFDHHEKVPRYAAAGIREVWLVDVESETVSQFTEPRGDAYQSMKSFVRGQTIDAMTSIGLSLSVVDILG